MQAVRYHGPRQPFRLEEVDRREPGEHVIARFRLKAEVKTSSA
jgi:hypothetical protein